MASLLSNLVNNVSERIHRTKRKFRHDKKKNCKISTTKYKDFNWFLENANFKDDLIE